MGAAQTGCFLSQSLASANDGVRQRSERGSCERMLCLSALPSATVRQVAAFSRFGVTQ